MTTRRKTKRDYSEVRRFAAHRRAGHEWWAWYVIWEPLIRRVGPFILAVGGLAFAWYRIPHMALGLICVGLIVAVGAAWAAWSASDKNLQASMNGTRRGTGLGWALSLVMTALAGAAWAAFFGPGS